VVFDMGDGDHPLCVKMPHRELHPKDPMVPSPDCGYTYQVTGEFTIVAHTTWLILWWVDGETGFFEVTLSASSPIVLPISELHAVVVAPSPAR